MSGKGIAGLLLFLTLCSVSAKTDSLFGTDSLSRPGRTYDVLHYKLELRFGEKEKKVMGVTTVSLLPLRSRCDSVSFDAVAMDVRAVVLGGITPLRFSNNPKQLTVYFDRSYTFEDTLRISIDYSAVPTQGLYFLSPDSTNPRRRAQIWSQGEDINNRHWFPCWDFPNDKATSEVIATVKDSWNVLSNGNLVSVKHDKTGKTKTFHWRQAKPHASYLIMLAAGEFEIIKEKSAGIPIEYYVYKDRAEDSRRSLSATPDVMKFFEAATGYPYPWEKYSQIFIDDFMWGGMENTSAVTLNTSYIIDRRGMLDFTSDDVVAHELAHQWFGDLVTCRDWTELWLNEGFANYFETLYKKHAKGRDESQLDLMGQATAILAVENRQGRKPLVSDNSYTTNLYSKGAWVLYMLENILGGQELHRAITYYLQRNAFTSVSTFDFQKAVEEATGQNMDWFFDQWVFKAGHPKLNIVSAWDGTKNELLLTIQQTQKRDSLTGIFVFPLDIECTSASGKVSKRVWVTKDEEVVRISLPEKPQMVIVDKGMKLLKEMEFERSQEELVYQLHHAEDMYDRMKAAKSLKEYPNDVDVFAALKRAALTDPFWAVRREATIYLGTMKQAEMAPALFEIYKDKKSAVRNAAIVGLEKSGSKEVAAFLRNALDRDSSYIVQASCLTALDRVDSVNAFDLARTFVGKESHRDILRRSALQVFRRQQRPESLPLALNYVQPGNASDIRRLALGVLRDLGKQDTTAREVVGHLTIDFDKAVRKDAIRTLGKWGDPESVSILERRKSAESDESIKSEIQAALDETVGK